MSNNSPNARPIYVAASRAFALDEKSATYKGAAQHAMAYAIRLIWEEFRSDGMQIVPAGNETQILRCPEWHEIVKSGSARKDFIKACKVRLNVAYIPKADKEEESIQKVLVRRDKNLIEHSHEQLIRNSVNFAAALAIRHIPMTDFYEYTPSKGAEKLPMWRVPLAHFLLPGWSLKGAAFTPEMQRAINGKSLPVHKLDSSGEDYVDVPNAVASISTFKLALFGTSDPSTPAATASTDTASAVATSNGANETQAHDSLPPIKVAGVTYRGGDFNALVIAAAKVANAWADAADNEHVTKLSDFPPEVANALAGLAIFYDECREASARDVQSIILDAVTVPAEGTPIAHAA